MDIILGIHGEISSVMEKDTEIVGRMNSLSESIAELRVLQDERDRLNAKLLKVRANAVIADIEPEEEPYLTKIEALSSEIKARRKRADAATAAMPILQSKRDQLAGQLESLNKKLSRVQGVWLRARHTELCEQLRSELHGLHPTIAQLIAIESSPHFEQFERTSDMLGKITVALPSGSPLRPDFLNAGAQRRAFPGFAAATAALEAEMNGEESAS